MIYYLFIYIIKCLQQGKRTDDGIPFLLLTRNHSLFNPRSIESAKNAINSFVTQAFHSPPSTTAIVCSAIVGLFAYEQYVYLRKKKSLPGPSFKIPIIGAFLDSLYPTFEGYMSKWKSGELSCVSVFDR